MKKRKKLVLHSLHIITTKKILIEQVESFARCIDKKLITCIVLKKLGGGNSLQYMQSLYAACWRLHMIARFVYKGKYGISKLPENKYREIIFEGFVKTLDEIEAYIDKSLVEDEFRADMARYILQIFCCLKKIIINPLTMIHEMVYIHEFAEAIDYVIYKDGNISTSKYIDPFFALVQEHKNLKREKWKELFDYEYMY